MAQVTVVIATRNRVAPLVHTLHRLAALPDRPGVIVVDNASDDATVATVRERFPTVRVLPMSRNEGAVARNHGVAAATTPYVAFADDDSWWAPGALDTAAGLLDTHPRLALIAARVLVGPEERLDPMSAFMATAPLGTADDLPGPSVLGFLACAGILRRQPFLDCGGFDPVVFFMGEEARLAYDFQEAGWGMAYCPQIVAHHHPAPAPAGRSGTKRGLAARNRALTAWMRRPLSVAGSQSAALLRAALTDPAARRAAGQFIARLPKALAARRAPSAGLEAALDRLAHAEADAGYRTDAPSPPLNAPNTRR
jgi:GT2 family glycosyltransferase